jgi:hypothetical protein
MEVTAYRDQHFADARRYGYALVFSLVALNDDGSGTDMTASQVTEYGTALLAGKPCAFYIWRYDAKWSTRPEIVAALDSLGRIAQQLPATSCRKPQ